MSPELQTLLYGDQLSLFEAFGLLMGVIFLLFIAALPLLILYDFFCSLIVTIKYRIIRQHKRRQNRKDEFR